MNTIILIETLSKIAIASLLLITIVPVEAQQPTSDLSSTFINESYPLPEQPT